MEAAEAFAEPPIRPRLELAVSMGELSLEDWRSRLKDALAAPDSPAEGYLSRRHCEVVLREEHRHYWSPALSIEAGEKDGVLRIHVRFGPHPRVWTLFVAIHTVLVFSAIAGSVVSATQLTLGLTPTALVGLPVALGFTALVHGINVWGQRQGADQMHLLHDWLFRSLRIPASAVLTDEAPH